MRKAFVAPPGMRLVVVDYSQLEVVILAHLIDTLFGDGDPLVKAVRDSADIHALGARRIFGELAGNAKVAGAQLGDFKKDPDLALLRELTKAGIYGRNYGKGPKGFATSFFLPDGSALGERRATELCAGLDAAYPGIPRYQEFIRAWITEHASIMTLFGRWQPLPNAKATKQGLRNRAWRQALNYPMQGGGQEIMALALQAVHTSPELTDMGFKLSLVVHDEIVGWAPEASADACLAIVEHLMCTAVKLRAPLKAKGHTGITWRDAK